MISNKISIVVPVFNAEESLDELIVSIIDHLNTFCTKYEIILVDDKSNDNSWQNIEHICEKYNFVLGLKFYENYGLDAAITEGLKKSQGDYVFIVTCDLTDPVNKMKDMYDLISTNKNLDLVAVKYENKHQLESRTTKFFSNIYWKIFSSLSGINYPVNESVFRVLKKDAVKKFLNYGTKFKHIKIIHTLGLKKDFINAKQLPRKYGKSGFSFKKKIEFAVDYLTTYTYKPLTYISTIGMFFSFSTLIISIFAIIGGLLNIFETSMWSYSLLIFASLFSLLFLNLTIIGIYLVRNIEETKKINDIVIEKETNFE